LGFGFEAIGLAVTRAEPMPARQIEFTSADPAFVVDGDRAERCAALIDALRQRLGPHRVKRFEPVASHLPERAEALPPVDREVCSSSWPAPKQVQPLLLLPQAEPAQDVTALVPDGPPRRFSWRGTTYDVAGAQGPQRIAGEWWRNHKSHCDAAPTRDYYLVEDLGGRRFWLFREGLYERETVAARWFVHGLFA